MGSLARRAAGVGATMRSAGAFADEVVGDDGAGLADAVGAVGGLVLDGGVPPAVVVDDVGGFGEGEAEGAGAEGEDEEAGAGVVGEGGDLGAALGGGEGAVEEGDGAAEAFGEGGAEGGADAGVLGEEEGGFAAGEDVVEEGEEGEELAGGGVFEAVAGAVADELEAGEEGEDGAVAVVVGAGVLGEGEVVGGGLGVGEGGVVLLGDAGGEVGEEGGVGLEAAEEEVGDGAAEALGVGVALGEVAAGAEEVGVEEVEDGPEVVEAVFDGGAGEGEAVGCGEGACGLGLAGGGVLDELGLVEDEGLPADAAEAGVVAPEVAVGGEDDVDPAGASGEGVAEGAVGADVAEDAEAGGPAGELALPHGQDGEGGDDEGGGGAGEEEGDGLEGLAEAHIVGEADAEAVGGGLHEPADALGLVGAEDAAEGQVAGGGQGHLAEEVLHGLGAGGDTEGAGEEEGEGAALGEEGGAEGVEGTAEGVEVNVAPFALDEGKGLAPAPVLPRRRIEFIGNSITCGYGIESEDRDAPFTYDTENHYYTYAALTARALQAQHLVVARSGIGVYRNYGSPASGSGDCMPAMYGRTLFLDPSERWEHSLYTPDVVCVNLGTNDVSEDKYDMKLLTGAYRRFVARLRDVYPKAKIVLLTGCMLNGRQLADVKKALDTVTAERREAGDGEVYRFDMSPQTGSLGYAPGWHPTMRQHRKMAVELTSYLKKLMNW